MTAAADIAREVLASAEAGTLGPLTYSRESAIALARALLSQAAELAEARALLREVEWVTHVDERTSWSQCPICHSEDTKRTHLHGCRLAALLAGREAGA